MSYDSYSNTYKFVGTDHKGNGINILYKGDLKFETREGETVILTGYLPDADNRTQMIAVEYMTNHGMEQENWEGNLFMERDVNLISKEGLQEQHLWNQEVTVKRKEIDPILDSKLNS